MTLRQQLKLISDTFASGLPALLATASLPDFDLYTDKSGNKSNQLELCVYPDYNKNVVSSESRAFVIKVQLYGKDLSVEYFDVIEPFIKSNIKPNLLGYTILESLDADFMPIDRQSTSYIFFSIIFSNELDDCD